MQGAFVSPRSLELASRIIKNREQLTPNALLAATGKTYAKLPLGTKA